MSGERLASRASGGPGSLHDAWAEAGELQAEALAVVLRALKGAAVAKVDVDFALLHFAKECWDFNFLPTHGFSVLNH